MTIRDSGAYEAETLFRIQREACVAAFSHIFPPDLYPFPDEAVRERWRTAGGRIVLAHRDGRPVGLAAVEGCWLNGLYVVPSEWGTGVARELHDVAVQEIAARHDEAKLWVLEENPRARRFYERLGWRENAEVRRVPFPPHPLDVGYSLDLSAASAASWRATR